MLCKATGAAGVRAGVGVMCVRTWNGRVMRRMSSQPADSTVMSCQGLCYVMVSVATRVGNVDP